MVVIKRVIISIIVQIELLHLVKEIMIKEKHL